MSKTNLKEAYQQIVPIEIRSQKSEISKTRDQRSEVRDQKSEVRASVGKEQGF
jgi:uncharacterized protein (DUF3084 family)